MEFHFELRDDTKVSSAAAQSPEQIGVFFCVCVDNGSIRDHECKTLDVVARKSVQTIQPPSPASQHQTSRPGVRHHTRGKGEPYFLGGGVNGAEKAATVKTRAPR